MYSTFAFGKLSTEGAFQRITIQRNEPADEDVQFDIGLFQNSFLISEATSFE
jgi:hypothetical protein